MLASSFEVAITPIEDWLLDRATRNRDFKIVCKWLIETLNLPEPRLSDSHASIVIPFDHGIVFVLSLNGADLPGRFSEVSQAFDSISEI